MQLLYSIDTINDTAAFKNPIQTLEKNFDKTRELLVFFVANTLAVAQYAERDARNRAAKNVPTYEDLNVNTKILGNTVLWQILEDNAYKNACDQFKTMAVIDEDIIRKIYLILVETEEYKKYINTLSRDKKQETQMLQYIFNDLLLQNEVFVSYCEDRFQNLDDDAEMLQSLVLSYFQRVQNLEWISFIEAEKWNFAKLLLQTCLDKKEYLIDIIKPKLKNWDADRIANLDLIILQMGLSELLFFETIPSKVTINEYIDIAKDYSTPQSGQFINGLLDNSYKELLAEGKIVKIDYRKK